MKKLLVLTVALLTFSLSTMAQKATPFVVPFASLNNSTMSYGIEAGLAYEKVWGSVSYTYTPKNYVNCLSLSIYNKIVDVNKANMWLYNSFTVDTYSKDLVYSPGVSLAYNLTTSITPIFTFSVPIMKTTTPTYTLGLMYNF